MLRNIKSKRENGFTIIEVLIVLAIAGLIMVVVFLAVPALQRNSRNSSRQTDARNLMSAASEVVTNKGGNPIVAADLSTITSNTKFSGVFTATDVTIGTDTTTQPSTASGKSPLIILPGYKCGSDPSQLPVVQARSTAVWYVVESGSSAWTNQCLAS